MNRKNLLIQRKGNLVLYSAGFPHFGKNFSRDSIISAILMQDFGMLRDQLIYSARNQGIKKDSLTGEEPGKIHHEIPEFKKDGLTTKYNACDTTLLYLIGHEKYLRKTNDSLLFRSQKKNLKKAIKYILNHIQNGFFIEDPKFSSASKFFLKATYWKDSELVGRKNGIPDYPVVYTLVQAQCISALRSAYFLFRKKKFLRLANFLSFRLKNNLYSSQENCFCLALDKSGKIFAESSDFLHMLFYLTNGDLEEKHLRSILNISKKLKSSAGYLTLSEKYSKKIKDQYHGKTVWPFEQAIINIGAKKFNLNELDKISKRIIRYFDTEPELIVFKGKKIVKRGCDPQLWTIASKKYFSLE